MSCKIMWVYIGYMNSIVTVCLQDSVLVICDKIVLHQFAFAFFFFWGGGGGGGGGAEETL